MRFTTDLTCGTCGEGHLALLRCSGCKLVFYCTKEHQKMSWRSHKPECHRIQEWRKQQANEPEESRIEPTPAGVIGKIIKLYRLRWSLDLELCDLQSLPMELIFLSSKLTRSLRQNDLKFLCPSVLSTLRTLHQLDLRFISFLRCTS